MVLRKVDGSCSKGWGREKKKKKKTMDSCVGKQEEESFVSFIIKAKPKITSSVVQGTTR